MLQRITLGLGILLLGLGIVGIPLAGLAAIPGILLVIAGIAILCAI